MGGSTPVSLDIRMQVWLETVPALLRKVNVKHVSIVTHSAGGVYTLNTLAKLRSILDPKAPYVALLGALNSYVSSSKTSTDIHTLSPMGPSRFLERHAHEPGLQDPIACHRPAIQLTRLRDVQSCAHAIILRRFDLHVCCAPGFET